MEGQVLLPGLPVWFFFGIPVLTRVKLERVLIFGHDVVPGVDIEMFEI